MSKSNRSFSLLKSLINDFNMCSGERVSIDLNNLIKEQQSLVVDNEFDTSFGRYISIEIQ